MALGFRQISLEVKALSDRLESSEFSNQLQFTVLSTPTQPSISSSTLEWQPVNNSQSYTVKATNKITGQELTASATSINLNLLSAQFGGAQLATGEYYISVQANGGNHYANSDFSARITYIVS